MCIRDRSHAHGAERLSVFPARYETPQSLFHGSGRSRLYCSVSYTHLRAHETPEHLVCRLLLEKKKKKKIFFFFFLMIRRPPRSTLDRSSAASDVYKRQPQSLFHGSGRSRLYC